jgi:formate dehydrogenase iron-sulfur subunit
LKTLNARGYDKAVLYDPEGVGGTHMMYVVPHGDHLPDYKLPEHPVAKRGAISGLAMFKSLGAYMFGAGLLATALHFLAVGPERPEDDPHEHGG